MLNSRSIVNCPSVTLTKNVYSVLLPLNLSNLPVICPFVVPKVKPGGKRPLVMVYVKSSSSESIAATLIFTSSPSCTSNSFPEAVDQTGESGPATVKLNVLSAIRFSASVILITNVLVTFSLTSYGTPFNLLRCVGMPSIIPVWAMAMPAGSLPANNVNVKPVLLLDSSGSLPTNCKL